MQNLASAMMAGLIATIVISVLMLLKSALGIMPELSVPAIIAQILGVDDAPLLGWTVHLLVGTVIYAFALTKIDSNFPTEGKISNGIVTGSIGWIFMMAILMPLAGADVFGIELGIEVPFVTLAMHLMFGAVLGWSFSRLTDEPKAMSSSTFG